MLGQFLTMSFNPGNIISKAAAYTMLWTDDQINIYGAYTLTLPAISTMKDSKLGAKTVKIVNTGTSTVTISCNSVDTLEDGSTAGATTVYLYGQNDFIVYTVEPGSSQWKRTAPVPIINAVDHIKDDSITGIKMTDGKLYQSVATDTNSTTAVNIHGAGGAACALTVTGVIAVAKDTSAGNITVYNGTNAVATFAKSQTAGIVTGEDGALANTTVAAGAVFTVVSSGGDARVIVNYTVA